MPEDARRFPIAKRFAIALIPGTGSG